MTGLPNQKSRGAYYELWLTKDGKPVAPCGSFRVNAKNTTVRLPCRTASSASTAGS